MTDTILDRANVVAAGAATTREEAIREAGALLVAAGAVEPGYIDSMRQREETVSTFMGNGLAIPHSTNESKDEIKRSALSFVRYSSPLDWGGEEVRFVVGIAGQNDEHLEILSKIAILFSEEDDVRSLIEAPDADALFALLGDVNE
ncbi:PTS system, mannitol-specific enzyme II, A component [Leifsonia xyli subsp. cynodontis DSM 46306]|jgi:PTS system mannitol-specific IIA component|uniref:Mannitol-specific phosphotransferase enzyme IIA component n=1 Tax=Leifsonia xyli subsp. cynodontis DSM 46306 TaxID=1389489 RepID=U3P629_LEIXC|nr:PTS sugar transporter subunit IIA [Leifsonia xyli]AGW40357.1 PTS system, mannitol-specific enzyme II, A component [Leifsonia xyli subsp. cynodontis DSM 46306]